MEDHQKEQQQHSNNNEKLFEHPTFLGDGGNIVSNVNDENQTLYELDSNFSILKMGSHDNEQQTQQQFPSNEKLFEHPTFLPDNDQQQLVDLDSNFSILKVEPEKQPQQQQEEVDDDLKTEEASNPDDFIIEKPENSFKFVDLNFTLNIGSKSNDDSLINNNAGNILEEKFDLLELSTTTSDSMDSSLNVDNNKPREKADESLINDNVGNILEEKFDLLELSTTTSDSMDSPLNVDNNNGAVSKNTINTDDIISDKLDKTPVNDDIIDKSESNSTIDASDESLVNQSSKGMVDKEKNNSVNTVDVPSPMEQVSENPIVGEDSKNVNSDFVEELIVSKHVDEKDLNQQQPPPPISTTNDDDNKDIESEQAIKSNEEDLITNINSSPSSKLMTESFQVQSNLPDNTTTTTNSTHLNDDDNNNVTEDVVFEQQPAATMMAQTDDIASTLISGSNGVAQPSPSFDYDDQQQPPPPPQPKEVVVASATTTSTSEEKSIIQGGNTAAVADSIEKAKSDKSFLDDDFLPTSAPIKDILSSALITDTVETKKEDENNKNVDDDQLLHQQTTIEEPQQEQQKHSEIQENFVVDQEEQVSSSSATIIKQENNPQPEIVSTSLTETTTEPLLFSSLLSSSSISSGQQEHTESPITQSIKEDQPEPSAPIHPEPTSIPKEIFSASETKPSTIMGKKNRYQGDNSSSSGSTNLEPDCVQQFIQTLFGQCAADILYWRDPKNSGAVFGAGLVILFSLTIFSVISVVAYTLLFTLLGTLSFRVYKNVMQAVNKTEEGHPFKEYLEVEITPSQERAHEIADQLLSHFNCFITRMRSVLLVEDYVESFKYLFLFWALTFIGAWFNGMTLVILAYIGAFSLPKLYEMNQAQIDQYINLVVTKINEITEKIPFLKKAASAEKKDN